MFHSMFFLKTSKTSVDTNIDVYAPLACLNALALDVKLIQQPLIFVKHKERVLEVQKHRVKHR